VNTTLSRLAACTIAVAAAFVTPSAAPAATQAHGLAGVGNWVWDYEQITPTDAAKFRGATGVVITTQKNTPAAIGLIHGSGALAFSYLNVYWLPVGQRYDGVDLGQHPEWQFCGANGAPLPGRSTGAAGHRVTWAYPDLNEGGMHAAVLAYMRGLKAAGYDGVFFDRGVVALDRGTMPGRVSGCTDEPVTPRATYGDAYARIVRDAHAIGLRIVLNFGSTRLPRSVAGVVDRVMQEDAPRSSPANDIATAFARRELEARRSTRYVEEVKTSRAGDRAGAFLAWSEVALWPIDVDINSGDSGCVGVPATVTCFHYGTFPELTGVRRGSAVTSSPRRSSCYRHSATVCLWVRRWSQAVVTVNETRRPLPAVVSLGATCRRVRDIWGRKPVAAGRCVRRLRVTIPPHSGRVYQLAARR
jgi:hypothetical protein